MMTNSPKNVELSNDVYNVLQEVKTVFSQIMGKDDISDEDVVATLLAGFIDGMEQQGDSGDACCSSGACSC